VKKKDEFEGSFGACIDRAKKLAKENEFPVVVIPWNNKKQTFETEELDKCETTREMINSKDFEIVRFKLRF
jgi:hypothetical protein